MGVEDRQIRGPFPWAGRPSAVGRLGQIVQFSDVGTAPATAVSDGADWIFPSGVSLARSVVQTVVTGTVNETAVATYTVNGGLWVVGGVLQVSFGLLSFVGVAGTKRVRVRLGGIAGDTLYDQTLAAGTLSSGAPAVGIRLVAANSQMAANTTATSATLTGTTDVTVDFAVVITMTLANAADSCTHNYSALQLF